MEKTLKVFGIVFLVLLVYFSLRFYIPEAPGYCTSMIIFILCMFINKKKNIRKQTLCIRRSLFRKKLVPGTSWVWRLSKPETPSIDNNLSAARNLWLHASPQN